MYIIGGLAAAAPLLWWHWWEPSKGEPSQDLTHTASGYHPMESIQAHNNPFPPPWCTPSRDIKPTSTTKGTPIRPQRHITVCVEGNIGSGKSTLLHGLQEAQYTVHQEPVAGRWKLPLQAFYDNPRQWSFSLQIEVLKWFKWLRDNVLGNPQPAPERHKNQTQRGIKKPQQYHQRLNIIERSPWAASLSSPETSTPMACSPPKNSG